MSGSQPVLNDEKNFNERKKDSNEVLNDGTSFEQTNLGSTSPSPKMSPGTYSFIQK